MTQNNDPHGDVHGQAAREQTHEQHDPVPVTGEGDYATKQDLADVNKTLTKRINDIRTDFGTFTRNVSNSVNAFQQTISTIQTDLKNAKDAIEAQDAEITLAKNAAGRAEQKAAQVEKGLTSLDKAVGDFKAEYHLHTHDLVISLEGETKPPKEAGGQ